jgi:hypothetical protein
MTFKTLSKRQNETVDPSLFSLHLIEGRVIPDWKKLISSGENIRFLGDYIAKHIRQNSSLQEGQSLYLAGLFSNPETVKNVRIWGFHNDATLNVILLIRFVRIQCMQNYAGIRLFLCACQTTAI